MVIEKWITFRDRDALNSNPLLSKETRKWKTICFSLSKTDNMDQYLNCKSHHQSSCKDSVISSLVNRTMDVVSENNDKETELTYVTNVLLVNGYTKQQIEKVKRKYHEK